MSTNDIIEKYVETPAYGSILIGELYADAEDSLEYFVLEAPAEALRFLGEILIAMANNEDDHCHWDIHPRSAGLGWFNKMSRKGLYVHRLPCESGQASHAYSLMDISD